MGKLILPWEEEKARKENAVLAVCGFVALLWLLSQLLFVENAETEIEEPEMYSQVIYE